jgi:hypothetical protein
MTPAKSAKKYQACGGRPDGAGSKAMADATATGASAFQGRFMARLAFVGAFVGARQGTNAPGA